MCRQAGYFDHASYLAKKYKRHEDYLRIQVEDAENYRDALAYVRRLDPEAVRCFLLIPYTTNLNRVPDGEQLGTLWTDHARKLTRRDNTTSYRHLRRKHPSPVVGNRGSS